jgi:hypothetical protein
MSAAECANCGAAVPAGSRFCAECGRPLAVEVGGRRRPSLAGLLVLVALAAIAGIAGFVLREWAWGVALLLLAGIVLLGRREVERRRAERPGTSLRARATAAREAMAARSREQVELFRARRELAELDAQRGRAFHELGRATFYRDEAAVEAARSAAATVLQRMREKEREIEALKELTERRVERAQLPVQPTQRLDADGAARKTPPPRGELAPAPDEPDPTRT